jgi:hypothetical protein
MEDPGYCDRHGSNIYNKLYPGSFLLTGDDHRLLVLTCAFETMYSPVSFLLLTLSIFSLPTSRADESPELKLRLMHRVVHPNLPVTPWSELGEVTIPPFTSIHPSGYQAPLLLAESLQDDLAGFAEAVDPNMPGAMYHVAIEHPLSEDALWSVSSMKAVGRALLRFEIKLDLIS